MDAPDLAEPPALHEPALRAANARPAAKVSAGRIAIFGGDIFIFRRWLIRDLMEAGWAVVALGPEDDDQAARLVALGAEYVAVGADRTGINPLRDIRTLWFLARALRPLKLDVFFSFHTKYNVLGPLAARLAGVPGVYALVAGLGYAFSPGHEIRRRAVRVVLSAALQASLHCCNGVFVQNRDDAKLLREAGWVRRRTPVVRLAGTGVDTGEFAYSPAVSSPLRVLLVARLLREKGIHDYIAAARIVKGAHPEVTFALLGAFESNPGAISQAQAEAWQREGVITYLGTVSDVRPHLRNCNLLVLPSYYREGIPKIILEAMAIGRAVVTCDVPGCREAVTDGVNGFLIPPRSPNALVHAIERLIAEPGLVASMGKEGRRLAEARFDVRMVNATMMKAMGTAPGGTSARRIASDAYCS